MQGISLAHPVKTVEKAILPKGHRGQILKTIREKRGKPGSWMYGNADAVYLPEDFHKVYEKPLESLNDGKTIWKVSKPMGGWEMPFGKGSVGTHTDDMSGVTLLVLLYCEPWVRKSNHPEYNGFDGEFSSQGKTIEMVAGDAIIFDDRKPHSWLTNSAWAFATFPLTVSRDN